MVRLAVGVAIVALVMHTWLLMGLVVPVVVSGSSMEPTLSAGDRLVISRTAYLFRRPNRWEAIVLRNPDRTDEFCVKRVFGLPGETVTLVRSELQVNGQPVMRSIIPRALGALGIDGRPLVHWPWPADSEAGRNATWRLGEDEYFVVGDNATVSEDSRTWNGRVTAKLLVGRPIGPR